MTHAQFLAETFPLIVGRDADAVRVEWYENGSGVARLQGAFVVEVWPRFTCLEYMKTYGAGSKYPSTYAYGWTGLEARVVEHGVGEITKNTFSFERFCPSRSRVNDICAEHHKELVVLTNIDGTPCAPVWECERPTLIVEELLIPMQRYIGAWL